MQISSKSLNLVSKICLCLVLLFGCKKETNSIKPVITLPEIKTVSIFNVGRLFKCRGQVVKDSNSSIIQKGICYDTTPFPTINNYKNYSDTEFNLMDKDNPSYFTFKLKGLKNGTTYYVRAFATTKDGTAYGEVLKFKTESSQTLVVGDDYEGGKIGYILEPIDAGYLEGEVHGIIVALNDLGEGYIWGGSYNNFLGAGKLNTVIQDPKQRINAALICKNLVLNGYTDWCLPCLVEFELVLSNMEVIGNFKDVPYWSSTHTPSSGNPWADPEFGYSFYLHIKYSHYSVYTWLDDKEKYRVRPIRYF